MTNSNKNIIQRLLEYNPSTDILDLNIFSNGGDTIKKEIYIDNRHFSNSTLDIWQTKGTPCADVKQYVKYKRVTIEFQLTLTCFINPYIDLYHYTFKRYTVF